MTLSELSTAVRRRLPIKICILNNGYMGMIRQWQELFYDRRYIHNRVSNPTTPRTLVAVGSPSTSRPTSAPRRSNACGEKTRNYWLGFHVEAFMRMSGQWSRPAKVSTRWKDCRCLPVLRKVSVCPGLSPVGQTAEGPAVLQ